MTVWLCLTLRDTEHLLQTSLANCYAISALSIFDAKASFLDVLGCIHSHRYLKKLYRLSFSRFYIKFRLDSRYEVRFTKDDLKTHLCRLPLELFDLFCTVARKVENITIISREFRQSVISFIPLHFSLTPLSTSCLLTVLPLVDYFLENIFEEQRPLCLTPVLISRASTIEYTLFFFLQIIRT